MVGGYTLVWACYKCMNCSILAPIQSHKYWRCRYLLLPASPPPDIHAPLSRDLEEEEHQEMLASRDHSLVANFARFMEFLNHIKRIQPAPSFSARSLVRRGRGGSLYGSNQHQALVPGHR